MKKGDIALFLYFLVQWADFSSFRSWGVGELLPGGLMFGTVSKEGSLAGLAATLAQSIDHTILKVDATEGEVRTVCEEARRYGFRGVCVRPKWAGVVAEELEGTPSFPVVVVDFPDGLDARRKVRETVEALNLDAVEVDMVIRRDLLIAGDHMAVERDIRAVVEVAGFMRVKVILESHLLSDEQIVTACKIVQAAGAHFVKTCTGFTGGGATAQAVQVMRQTVGPDFGVKASGGIRTVADARLMLAAGANVLGCSAGVAIVTSCAQPIEAAVSGVY